jgi:hypothetical protein
MLSPGRDARTHAAHAGVVAHNFTYPPLAEKCRTRYIGETFPLFTHLYNNNNIFLTTTLGCHPRFIILIFSVLRLPR